MNLTPDEQGDRINRRHGMTRTADNSEYYVIRTEKAVHRSAIPDVAAPSFVDRMMELAHPFVLNRQRSVYAIRTDRMSEYARHLDEIDMEYEIIEDCAPFKIPSQLAVGQLVLLTDGGTLPSPSLEMEGEG